MPKPLNWKLLGDTVKARRDYLGLSQTDITARGGPSPTSLRTIENATADGMRSATLYAVEKALSWSRGTATDLLRERRPSWHKTTDEWTEELITDLSTEIAYSKDFTIGKPPVSGDPQDAEYVAHRTPDDQGEGLSDDAVLELVRTARQLSDELERRIKRDGPEPVGGAG